MLCNGANMCEYEAYWHINFSLVGVIHANIIFVIILSFEVALVSLPIL